jgi:spore coat protein CotH
VTAMPHFRTLAAGCVLAVVALVTDAHAQTAADLFDRNTLHEIRLWVNSRDLQQLRSHYLENTYYVADFQWRNLRVRNVAIRSRGSASRNPLKPALRVDFNRYTTGQQFLGLKSLVLDNVWQDGSFVAESTAMAFFERMGQAASRESFCRLYINNVYHGVYAIVESVDADFVTRTTKETGGYLFSYQYHSLFYGEYLGDDYTPYKETFEPQTHELESDTILYSPIRDLFKEVNGPEDAVWRDRVEQYLDVNQLVTYVAIETFLAENDGFLGASAMNNFYLYRPSDSTRHRLFPWDKDNSFVNPLFDLMTRVDESVIFRRLMTYPDLRARYFQVLGECARSAAEDGWMEAEITRAAALVANAVREDTLKPFSSEAFDGAVDLLLVFARTRSNFVLRELDRLR